VRRWASGTTGAGSRLFVRSDGQLAVVRADGSFAWTSGTNGWTGAVATLTNDGILQVRQAGTLVWDHRGIRYDRLLSNQVLRTGESLTSTSKAWSLTMRTDGNLVLASSAGARRWASFTAGVGNFAAMQTDGNFVVRNKQGVTQWSTRTTGAGSFLRVLGTGNAAVYRSSTVTWAVTGGPAPQSWSCYSRATPNCISRFGYHGQRAWNYPVDAWGNNCTNFSAYRLSLDGIKNPGNLGNAVNWDNSARSKGFAVDQSPRVGDIAQWNSNHVAYVDWVSADGNQVAISESGYGGTVLGRTYTSMSGRRIIARTSSSWPSNFIHFR
jgi:surface antigen